jgi:hypothetical protein
MMEFTMVYRKAITDEAVEEMTDSMPALRKRGHCLNRGYQISLLSANFLYILVFFFLDFESDIGVAAIVEFLLFLMVFGCKVFELTIMQMATSRIERCVRE